MMEESISIKSIEETCNDILSDEFRVVEGNIIQDIFSLVNGIPYIEEKVLYTVCLYTKNENDAIIAKLTYADYIWTKKDYYEYWVIGPRVI